MEARPRSRWVVACALVALLLAAGGVTSIFLASASTTTSTSTSTSIAATTTTTVARERPQVGWAVASASGRGVMVDIRLFHLGAATFRAVRFRARTTLLRWHVGLGDPNLWARAPKDAGPSIDWSTEGPPGVVGLFNGGFKQAANAGGAMVDGVTLIPLAKGRMSVAIDAGGHWAMGVWGANFPPAGFRPIAVRQNLIAMVARGAPTALANSESSKVWGSPLGNVTPEARTGLGVDANGDLVYVATMNPVVPIQLARAMVKAGVVTGMQLDINPYWPILGVPLHPVHAAPGVYPIKLSGAQHDPSVYEAGWVRDFFVVLAQPSSWTCSWRSPGISAPRAGQPQPQPLRRVGRGCAARALATTTTSRATPGTSTSGP